MSNNLDSLVTELNRAFYENDKVGIMISGGLDSGLLLYLLLGMNPSFVSKMTVFTVPRFDDSIVHATRMVNWVAGTFNQTMSITEVGDPNLFHSRQVNSGVEEALTMVDTILLGDTLLPTIKLEGATPIRHKNSNPKVNQIYLNLKFDKTHVVRIAHELGLYSLFSMSHTCTQSKMYRCNECWQCRERAWAFKELGLQDSGEM